MSPSLLKLGAAALAYGAGAAALKTYQVSDSYDTSNFFDKFDFFESNYNTGDYNNVDPTSGWVNYQNQSSAQKMGLISTGSNDVRIGVDSQFKTTSTGRASVRLSSKTSYTDGLFIAKFNHFPKPVCGSWPAFWMVGPNWPAGGEIDIYEAWNLASGNQFTLHTDSVSKVGSCKLNKALFTDPIVTPDCDNFSPTQYTNQGCGVTEETDLWGNSNGGVYATEWQDDHLSIWSWDNGAEPADIKSGNPNPSGWGKPGIRVDSSSCNVAAAFSQMSIIINLDFCGVAGSDSFWGPGGCQAKVHDTCNSYVSNNPADFADVFFDVAYIKIYELQDQVVSTTTTSTTSTTSTEATTSAVTTSTTATTAASTHSSAAAVTSSAGSGNSTISAPGSGSGSGSGGLVTSTVSETHVYTVTSCAPEITDCPARIGRVTTEVTVYTTICPVTATETASSKPTTTPPVILQPTSYATKQSTVVVTMQTTVKQTTTAIVVIPSSSAPAPQLPPSAPAAPPAPIVSSPSVPSAVQVTPSTAPSKGNVTIAQPTGVVTVNGGFKTGASFVLMAAGAVLAFAL